MDILRRDLDLHRMSTGHPTRVETCIRKISQKLFQYQGHLGAALIIGGVDATGPVLASVSPHGYVQKTPYLTMGSGSLAAMASIEAEWDGFADLDEEAAIEICRRAIRAGIFNDLGSGSSIDVAIVKKDTATRTLRHLESPNARPYRPAQPYRFPKGTTAVKSETRVAHRKPIVVPAAPGVAAGEAMQG